jgi:hypothetical protein
MEHFAHQGDNSVEEQTWENLHLYYSDVDRLILECVNPILRRRREELEHLFWERHFAGGSHLRVRLHGEADRVRQIAEEIEKHANAFMAANPSAPAVNYSPERVRKLLEMEDEYVESEDLSYRVNCIERHPYERLQHRLASDEAAAMVADFCTDAAPLVIAMMKSHRPRLEEMLRLYFLEVLFLTGKLPSEACVSFKSHWTGFAAFNNRQLVSRIESTYAQAYDTITSLMLEVEERFESDALQDDEILGLWWTLLKRYCDRARATVSRGGRITFQLANVEQVRQAKQRTLQNEDALREYPFLRALWGDERVMASFQYSAPHLVGRIVTNLMYLLVGMAGLTPIEKMTLCKFAYQAVEDYFGVDFTEMMRRIGDGLIEENQDRFAAAEGPDAAESRAATSSE